MKWLIGILVVLAALAGFVWYAALDATPPEQSEGEFDLAAYRALVAGDAPETLPTEVRVEFVASSTAPSFAVVAGAFDGDRTMSYNAFQIVAPDGDTIIDGAVDADTINEMSDGKGRFSRERYALVLDALTRADRILITHEHLDHVMAIARHPQPAAIAAHLDLTRAQLDALPEHASNGQLAPEIAQARAADYSEPTRIAPGVVAHAAPGHSAGTIVIYAKTAAREYLFIGDIAWVMESVQQPRGRPRLIHWVLPGVDPDRPAVLRQLRELHDMAEANPGLVLIPAHDDPYLRRLVSEGILGEAFVTAGPPFPPE